MTIYRPTVAQEMGGDHSINKATFIVNFNQRFAKTPKYPKNLHRPVAETIVDLDDIFSWQETRKLSKSLTFRYDKMIYLVEPTEENTRIAGENIKGTVCLLYTSDAADDLTTV